jgi:CheY-like chemotaxis protein
MNRRVLLVDDDLDTRAIFRAILEHSGFCVLEAVDGEEGVRLARDEKPAVVLMDVSIPKLDGWDATRALKADAVTSSIPVIALTAHALPSDRQKALDVGCVAFLAKPVEPLEVVSEVRRVLARE